MKLWLIRPVTPWDPWYDKTFGFVVRAESEEAARALANEDAGDEIRAFPDAWTNPLRSSCEELTEDGAPEVIIRDFAAA